MSKAIRVKRHFNCLNPGEVAVFEDEVAQAIIERGLGEEVPLDKAPKTAGDTPKAAPTAAAAK